MKDPKMALSTGAWKEGPPPPTAESELQRELAWVSGLRAGAEVVARTTGVVETTEGKWAEKTPPRRIRRGVGCDR